MKEYKLIIENMKCEGCVNRIKNALSLIKGLKIESLSLEDKTLIFSAKNEKVVKEAKEKIASLDFIIKED